jgi:hypothetical protein
MARLQDMEGDNANIMRQHREWQEQRRSNSEDANDWSAFRDHLKAIGAPDPGEDEAEDFRMEGSSMEEEGAKA